MANQLRDTEGPTHIPLDQAKLMMGLVDKAVSNYPPGGEEIAYIAPSDPLKPYLVEVKT